MPMQLTEASICFGRTQGRIYSLSVTLFIIIVTRLIKSTHTLINYFYENIT